MVVRFRDAAIAIAVFMSLTGAAHAQSTITAYAGGAVSTRLAGFDPGNAVHLGASVSRPIADNLAWEVDLGVSPSLLPGGRTTTVTGGVTAGPTRGWFRPYATGGIGWMHSTVSVASIDFSDLDGDGLAMSVGGGLRLGGTVGVRTDLRYVRQVTGEDPISLVIGRPSYWRGTLGVSVGF